MPRDGSRSNRGDGQDPAWSIPSLREPRYSQSLERGLAILGCFTPSRPVLGIADIADDLGMSRSTTHRYVITLLALGYLEQGASRKYRLGMRVTDLGMAALNSTGLGEHAQPYLDELRQRTSYTTTISVLDGTEILCVASSRTYRRGISDLERRHEPGSRLPAHATAIGKMLMAHLPDSEQRDVIAEITPTKLGPKTITGKRALRDELVQIRGGSLALNDEELAAEMLSVAAPVRNGSGEVVAAVNVTAPSSVIAIDEMVDVLGPHLISTADRISQRLGYRRADEQNQ
ncbi:MAG TPA: IclR family transcriptional regulator [Solirubrobacteraceae bacterium]|jgi:IclR family pca regulon transcriptional regulator|nr:IclR family transcriptional regulator [Solirubrobacteraceae bacterium]